MTCKLKMKSELKLVTIPFSEVASWCLVSTLQEYITCKQNLNKEGLQLLVEIKSGEHIITSKEFKMIVFICCFGLSQTMFSETQSYRISDKDLQIERLRQQKPLFSINIRKMWQRDKQDPYVDMKKIETAYRRRISYLESI